MIIDIVKVISFYIPLRQVGKNYKACCPFHEEKSPSFTVSEDDNFYYCFGCGSSGDAIQFIREYEGRDFKQAITKLGEILEVSEKEIEKELQDKNTKENKIKAKSQPLDKELIDELFKVAGYTSNGYRSIRDDINKFFGHLSKIDNQGKVLARYYPETNDDGKLVGYKCRNHPKDFTYGKIGSTGSTSQLSGQVKFKSGGKRCLICGGEEDKAAAYQMLLDHQRDRGQEDYSPIPVVSPTAGENSAAKQCAAQYDWFDKYDEIIIGMDNDKAGIAAAIEISKVLPKEKIKIATWSSKDPNKMLEEGKQKQFIRDFYNAKEFVSTGIKSSTNLINETKAELINPVIPLPPYLEKLSTMTKRNGIIQGYIVNIIGDTSVGKTTHVNTITYHWLFNAPEKVGIVSLENTAGQYTMDLLSLHLGKNLYWLGDGVEIIEYLDRAEVKALYDDLLVNEYGEPRFYIIDERDGDIKKLEKQIERLISQYGCKIIVIDVLTDILRSLGNDAQEEHMNWQKRIKKNGITLVNVLHTRKPQSNQDGTMKKVTEYDALGSSTFVQSADINIVINRDKMTTDIIERNRTYWDIPKLRRGQSGHMGSTIYDGETRANYDMDVWLESKKSNDYNLIPPSELEKGGVFDGVADYDEYLITSAGVINEE